MKKRVPWVIITDYSENFFCIYIQDHLNGMEKEKMKNRFFLTLLEGE